MIILYYTPGSGASRLVLMVIAALRLDVELVEIDLQNINPDFIKANPQHTVPTLVDDGFAIWESRAVARYLVNKYGEYSTLYPSDPQTRGIVDARLDFDLGTLCPNFAQYFQPQLLKSNTPPTGAQTKKLNDALTTLNTFLEGQSYVAGTELTIADLALVATVSTIDAADVDLEPYPNITRWYNLVKENAPGYKKYNEKGLADFKRMVANIKQLRGELPSYTDDQTSADNQPSHSANEDPATANQHVFKLICDNKPCIKRNSVGCIPCLTKFTNENDQKLNVGSKQPYTNADFLKNAKDYWMKKKFRKQVELKNADCSCSISNDPTSLVISMVNRPTIGPMLDPEPANEEQTELTPKPSIRNRLFTFGKLRIGTESTQT